MSGASPAAAPLTVRAARAFAAYVGGDASLMPDLVEDVTPLLWHVARGQGLPASAAEDVVQQTWLRLVDDLAEPADAVEPTGSLDDTVLDSVVAAEERSVLWEHVAGLSDRCRYLLRVIAFADRPDYAAIATALGMPVGSIGPTRGRCLATLRAALLLDPAYETGDLS